MCGVRVFSVEIVPDVRLPFLPLAFQSQTLDDETMKKMYIYLAGANWSAVVE